MLIPKHWARAKGGGRTSLGWSDVSLADAERKARERLARLLALGDGPAPQGWDYYPSAPLKEEILETPHLSGATALVTRNRAGAQVLNVDRVAFIDIDLHERGSLLGSIGALFRKAPAGGSPDAVAALARAQSWAAKTSTRLRAYRTAGGLRLLRMDALLDPAGDECRRMFTELSADPQYAELCRIQRSFRARLTPKPRRVGCREAPCSYPRTDPVAKELFERRLAGYESACAGRPVCSFAGEYGTSRTIPAAQALAALHDQRTVLPEGKLA